jgi:hypothetical protein
MASPKSSGRMIRKSVSESGKIPVLSPEAAVLFFMLIPHYSSHGKMLAGPGVIKDEVVPLIPYFTYDNLPQYLQEISDNTSVKWFRHNGKWYLHSLNFLAEHQDLREDRLGKDELPDYPLSGQVPEQSGSSPGAKQDLPLRAEVGREKREENQGGQKPASSQPEEEKATAPPYPPASAEAGRRPPSPPPARQDRKPVEETAAERQIRATIAEKRERLERLFPWVEIDVLEEKICARYRGQPVIDPWLLVLEAFKREPRRRGTSGEVEEVLKANGMAVREFAGGDPVRMRFAVVLAWLAERYPLQGRPRPLSVSLLLDWHEALADVDPDDLAAGARRHWRSAGRDSRFFPSNPGVLRESVQAVVAEAARRSVQATVEEAQAEPEDSAELARYYQETIEGARLMGLDVSGWYVDESGDRPRLVTGQRR